MANGQWLKAKVFYEGSSSNGFYERLGRDESGL